MLKSCLRWGYLFAVFSFLAVIVAFFLYGQNITLPEEPGVSLFYRAGFVIANPLVDFFQIESLFAHIMLAGCFQVVISFFIGATVGGLYHLMRQ